MIPLSFRAAKGNFFSSARVKSFVDKATRRALSKAGAFVRRRAKDSIKYRDKPAAPGRPPSAHKSLSRVRKNRKGKVGRQTVSPLKEFIFFSYDRANNSVVVGPVLLNGLAGRLALPAVEYGGTSVTTDEKGRRKTLNVRPHPFMRPALERERKNVPELFRGSVK